MREIHQWFKDNEFIPPLSPACELCANGSKMVLLITGKCPTNCYYCPISLEKGGKDRIFADEWELDNENDIDKLIHEAEYIDATGAGITGGDPLIVWKRSEKFISILKDNFGKIFHIHLYTSGIKNSEHIEDLVFSGLDEIRFHPSQDYWSDMNKSPIIHSIKTAIKTNVDVAIEIPSIPKTDLETYNLIKWANEIGIRWINLNELEYSERNLLKLNSRNYRVKNDISSAVKGSQENAIKVLKKISNENFDIGVHYCSSSFKDGIQLKNRIKRRALNIAKDHEIISEDGTLIKGAIYAKNESLYCLIRNIKNEFNISEKFIFLDKKKERIEIGVWILEKIAKNLKKRGFESYIVEEYPTADRLEVERIPL